MARTVPPNISEINFDAIIIGAGINGVGIARDAAMRGLRVLLLDKGDVAGGTSSWSTRLIHGGLRYLEHGELGLVRESLRERETLLRIAPHLVRPLPMLIPIYGRQKRGALLIRAGMLAYDLLSFDKTLPRHRMLSRAETLRRAPALDAEGLKGAALYYDAQVEFAERLVLENALDARAHGATVLTRASIERIVTQGNTVRGVEFRNTIGGETYTARAPLVLNAAGPWVDEVLARTGQTQARRMIGGTKGSHLVLEAFAGAPPEALYVEARADARPFFVIPWNNLLLVGTTDTRYEGDLNCVVADEHEINYLLDEINRLLPTARLAREQVLYTYAGLRPLPFEGGSPTASSITRRHFVHDHAPGIEGFISIIGGKLTTYRNLAEEAVDLLFKKLGRISPRCLTAETPLPGARAEDFKQSGETFRKQRGLPEAASERLLKIYGVRAWEVVRLAQEAPELSAPFDASNASLAAEIVFAFREEMAETLADCLLRRTMTGLNRNAGLEAVEQAANIAQTYLGWNEQRAAHEVESYRQHVARFRQRTCQNS